MSKKQANISLSKAFKDHKSKEKIFYLAKKDKDSVSYTHLTLPTTTPV